MDASENTKTLQEAQTLYPNIVDMSEEFSNPAPTESEVLAKLREMLKNENGYATATPDKKLRIKGNRKKIEHIYTGDNYRNDNNATRKFNRKLAFFSEKIITNAEFIEAELPISEKNKEYLIGMHNYEVPIYVNGHGYLIRLEGEVIKNASDFSPGNKALNQNTYVGSDYDKVIENASDFSLKNQSNSSSENTYVENDSINNDNEILLKLQAVEVSNLYVMRKQKILFYKENTMEEKMENYVITQERNGEISVLASSYKNAIFVGEDYLSDYETYNLEKVNNLLKDLQESNPDNEYRIMTEDDFRQTYLLEENKLSPAEYLTEKINASGINIHLNKEEMKAILEAGKDVQKLAVKYGTNQNIESENENTFNGYGTYVVSVNEENARQMGIKIASRKYGGTFYINNQSLSQFLQEKNFSPYWLKRFEQLNTNSVDNLSHEILMANVGGNPTLEKEQTALATLLSLDLVEYKREQTYLYSVEIPDNDNTNYLLYNNPIGIDQATKINNELVKMGVEWRASRNDIGKNIYFELLSKNVFDGNQKAASEFLKENVGFVGMQMDNANYIIFNDKDMSINNRVQYMKSENGEVYGFTFDGEIYIDEDLVNSNVLAHEYTHIWDNYVQRNNPELWQKGMTCLKGTSLWYEITEDKNYENLRTDDEILSECHARIVGKMAEQVLERIAARDGELTKDKIIDWDREVSEYVATELLIKPELGDENYISESVKAEYLKEFLSMPMKDLMNEVRIRNFNQSNDIQEMRKNIEALKTPFGQNSKLNYNEWTFTRSDEFKKQFGDWESIQKKQFLLSNETVISLTGDEFPKKEGISLTEQVQNFFQKNTDNIISPFFGKVSLDKRGLKSSVYHGVNRIKAIAYAAVPEVINNGVIIDKSINHKNRGYDSYVVAAPIKIKEENYICEVVLKKNKNGTQFYLHEVTEQKKYLDRAFVTRRGNSPAQNPGTMVSLLDNIISVNSPVLCPMNENGEPEKSFVENELKKIQKYAESIDNSQTENSEESIQETKVENVENQIQEEQPKTIIPEFAMITQHGLKTYTNMVVDNYEEHTKSYLLKSQDGQETVRITENTLKELTSNEHQQKSQRFDENTKAAEKMIETQYKDFFEPRKNCANYFRHNLSVFCRKEANSPLDALKVANSLISQMPKEEKRKTKDLLNLLRKDGQTVNEVIIDTYHEAVKEVPLNEEYLNNKRYDKMIARPMYDTISDKGQKLDRDFNLKIGDSVKVTFKVDKNAGTKFSLKKENLFQECTIISSSKEANKVTLMDGNKSFYDVPRDTFLKEYAKREKIEHKQEQKKQRSYSMKLDVER